MSSLTVAVAAQETDDCPPLDLPQSYAAAYCEEFRDILYGPFNPGGTRDAESVPNAVEQIIEGHALWDEVYRADPRRTLALIQRIRDAGGLNE